MFELHSKYKPAGDQPKAISQLIENIKAGTKEQVLLGATGTGKTYTMANVIESIKKPTLILAHNKTLASQLYGELKSFFPNNRVEYFVSYFDYYQPEAYLPGADTYIDKDSKVNEEIDRMRHSATASLLERDDVIVVSSVSCIYGLGNPNEYKDMTFSIRKKMKITFDEFIYKLIDLQYDRNDIDFKRGTFRVRGDIIDLIIANGDKTGYRFEFFDDEIESIIEFDVLTGKPKTKLKYISIFPASHYVSDPERTKIIAKEILTDMEIEVNKFKSEGKLLEAQRLEQRTKYDVEMLQEVGFCSGIENYTRYLSGLESGQTPYTLFDFFPKDFLLLIDESHVTVPQIRGMYNGDFARKSNLVNYGFRLTSALDNRPLRFEEFEQKKENVIYVSATPGDYEKSHSSGKIVEQIIRPTGLLDPIIEIRKKNNQIDDIIKEIKTNKNKTLITTLTKRMSEDLTTYFKEMGIRVEYLHSEIKTFERIRIIEKLRANKFDVLIGINLLREGLDIPEVSRVIILDADKEGFLRSTTSLIQTIGRAARNEDGRVIMYADNITKSMNEAMSETQRRREQQMKYNKDNGITPMTIIKDIPIFETISEKIDNAKDAKAQKMVISELKAEMHKLSDEMDFENAAKLRDLILEIEGQK